MLGVYRYLKELCVIKIKRRFDIGECVCYVKVHTPAEKEPALLLRFVDLISL